MRLLRALLLFVLGFWAGMFASAVVMRKAFPSHGDAESDEVRLVAIQNGIAIKSRAQAFRGGSMFSWFGGIAVDGVDVAVPDPKADDAPTLRIDGFDAFGGVAVGAKPTDD